MDMRKYSRRSAYIKVDDVRDQPRDETIAHVKEGKFGKPDLTFESGKVFSINTSNTETLIAAYGADSDLWINKQIKLYPGSIHYQGEDHEAVLIKPITPPVQVKQKKEAKAADDDTPFDDEIEIPY